MHKVDTRGMSCPQPVLMTKKALEIGVFEMDIIVDNTTALNNVTRFLNSQGFQKIENQPEGEDTIIHAVK